MSNNEEENLSREASTYWREMKKQREKNAEAEQALKAWEADPNPHKPPRDFAVPPVLTEEQMHEKAKATADLKNENQKKLDQVGLGDRSMEDHYGEDKKALERAMERRKQREAKRQREQELKRDRGHEMD